MEGEGRLEGTNSKVLVELLQEDHRFHSVHPELDLARRRNLQPEASVPRPVDSALSKRGVLERNPQVRLEPQQVDSGPRQLEDLARRRNLQPEALVLRPVDSALSTRGVLERNPQVRLEPQQVDSGPRQLEGACLRRLQASAQDRVPRLLAA